MNETCGAKSTKWSKVGCEIVGPHTEHRITHPAENGVVVQTWANQEQNR